MILSGHDVPAAMMLINNPCEKDADGNEVIVVAYHDGQRYAFRSDAQARFVFGKMGWGEPTITHVRRQP